MRSSSPTPTAPSRSGIRRRERMFGFTEAEALGQSLDLIIPQRQRQRHWDGYDKTMETGHTKYGTDVLRVPALHKDGRAAVHRVHGGAAVCARRQGGGDRRGRARRDQPLRRGARAAQAPDRARSQLAGATTGARRARRQLPSELIGDRTDEQGARRRSHPRFHPRAVGPDVHAAAGLVRRRRDQGRARRRRRCHARPAARHPRRRQPVLHDAQPQQALDHARHQEAKGQGRCSTR